MTAQTDNLAALQTRIGYTFRDPALLVCAVTHPSHVSDHPESAPHNQRFELLGDAVLQLIITDALFQALPNEREGGLSKSRSTLTRGGFFARLAREIDLGPHLRLGNSELQTGGRERDSILEDAFEALAGALYLDAGLEPTRRVVLALYGPILDRLNSFLPADNPKGRLQELVQPKHGNSALRYDTVHASGEDHQREYESTVYFLDKAIGTGRGTSKKTAEEAAARAALIDWKD